MKILVSDASVLIDLERGTLLAACFRLPFAFAVPDLLYERELRNYGGEALLALGLRVEELDGDGVALALQYRRAHPPLSLADCFALTLAKINSWMLLSGDGGLRDLAAAEGIECRGVLWLLDRMLEAKAARSGELLAGLQAIAAHPRCRLPAGEIRKRLRRYADL